MPCTLYDAVEVKIVGFCSEMQEATHKKVDEQIPHTKAITRPSYELELSPCDLIFRGDLHSRTEALKY